MRQIVTRFRSIGVSEPRRAKGKTAAQKTSYLALAKCRAAARRFPRALIIAADTLASCRGKIMGKPENRKDARAMLKRLSGQRLDVATSIAIAIPGRQQALCWPECGWVKFRKLGEDEISRYLSSSLWRGKAAAVNAEEKPVRNWIVKKGGEFGAVAGLPAKKLGKALHDIGI